MSKSKPDALLLRVMSAIHKTAETPAPGYRTVAEWATRWKMSRNSAWDNLEKGIKLGFIDKRQSIHLKKIWVSARSFFPSDRTV